jgi:hypothetical protein
VASIEYSLYHLQDCVNGFILPSTAVRDIRILRAQIELRRLALKEIEVIRCRLRPVRSRRRLRRRLPLRSTGQSRPIQTRI